MRARCRVVVTILACALFAACGGQPTKRSVQAELDAVLHAGDPRSKIESVLTSKKIGFSYDRFQNRYQSAIPLEDKPPYHNIGIFIYLDEKREHLLRIEVDDYFTSI